MKLEGKVAIVTGGGQGIGEGIARCIGEEGADVAIIDRREDTAQTVAADIEKMGRKAMAVEADATNNEQVVAAVQQIADAFGKIDILVNNLGGGGVRVKRTIPKEARTGLRCVDSEEAAWDNIMDLNAKSVFLMCRAVVPYFLKQKSGKIINIGSRLARQVDIPLSLYCTAKAAVVHYTNHLALELAPYGINVNYVGPGDVLTPNIEAGFRRAAEVNPAAKGKTPEALFLEVAGPRMAFNRIQTPEDMGRATVFLASADARAITGQTLYVDGGQTFL
jgi:NAD(P)-dependent dehydrogenase (short-subunit alcohol dehydrogenase family)